MHIIDSHFHWRPRSMLEWACKAKGYPRAERDGKGGYVWMIREGYVGEHPQGPSGLGSARRHARAYGRARPSGRRRLHHRSALGLFFRAAAGSRPRCRDAVERGDGGGAAPVSRPVLGHRGGAAEGHQGGDRGARSRGQQARPDAAPICPAASAPIRASTRSGSGRSTSAPSSSAFRCSCIRPTRSSRTFSKATTTRCTSASAASSR